MYTKQIWANGSAGGTPVSADRLQHIEDGVLATSLVADGAQPGDPDLTAIAAIDSTQIGLLGSNGVGWIYKSYASVKIALNLVKADVGLSNVDNTSDINKPVSTAQANAITSAIATQHTADNAAYVAQDHTHDETNGTISGLFTSAAKVATKGGTNSIVGMAHNDQVASSNIFPTGVTGYGRTDNAGNQVFGIFGRADLEAAGVATNEFNAFNFASAPSGTFPPDRSIGTVDRLPIVLTVASGGSFASAIGIHICKEGSTPQSMLAGIYANSDACTTYGIFLDSTSTVGPGTGILIKTKTAGIGLEIDSPTGQTSDSLRILLNAVPVVRFTPSGGLKCTTSAVGGGDDVFAILSADHSASKAFRVANVTGIMQILNTAFNTAILSLDDTGNLTLNAGFAFNPITQTTAPAAGAAAALPATPAGYATITVGGTARKVAYY